MYMFQHVREGKVRETCLEFGVNDRKVCWKSADQVILQERYLPNPGELMSPVVLGTGFVLKSSIVQDEKKKAWSQPLRQFFRCAVLATEYEDTSNLCSKEGQYKKQKAGLIFLQKSLQ